MTIHISSLTFNVIIGLLDFEREKQQRVIIDLEAMYDYKNEQFIDYADITLLIKDELKSKRYKLLEEALIGLKTLLLTAYPQLKTLTLKITKPDILEHCEVALSHSWIFTQTR
jgi:dihydroneopterin aldolase